ncbi:hypothetical protein BCO_0900146 (plasmid) [Borrelia coriaceae ATCC 43381]|uniref:Uncharacterized protein n=2 Tax=Borrelia coriaceae TaxID=144 RepID=W5SYQ4_9SPIR|nr:hypothetical protein [Borrelia coriaceae]AHH11838.1 hypothetical protein BCO_0900146 [Borrelia coriaceae ATCC 43381]
MVRIFIILFILIIGCNQERLLKSDLKGRVVPSKFKVNPGGELGMVVKPKPEAEKDKPEEVREDKPEEAEKDKPEEVREDKPEEVREDKPEEVREDKPEEVREDKPEEVREDKPEEVKEDKPEEVKEDKPEEVKEDKPEVPILKEYTKKYFSGPINFDYEKNSILYNAFTSTESGELIKLERDFKTREGLIAQFIELRNKFVTPYSSYVNGFVHLNKIKNKPITLYDNVPPLVLAHLFDRSNPETHGEFSFPYDEIHIYSVFQYVQLKIQIFAAGVDKLKTAFRETGIKRYKDVAITFVHNIVKMTHNLVKEIFFKGHHNRGASDFKAFKEHATLDEIKNLNIQLDRYLVGLRAVEDRLTMNMRELVNNSENDYTVEDVYYLFDKINKDEDVQRAISIVKEEKDNALEQLKAIMSRVRKIR